MERLRRGCWAMILWLALAGTTGAQVNAAKADTARARDHLIRLFMRTESKHAGSRRNLNKILRQQPRFWQELHAVARRLKTHPAWLLNVMACESLFDPTVRNPLPGQTASGLLQIIESTARSIGTTAEEIRRMSPKEQLHFVERYFEPFRGRFNTLADVYTAVFRGAIIEGGDAVVVLDSGKEQRVYSPNRSLDLDKDGRITKGELALAALSIGRFLPAQARVAPINTPGNDPPGNAVLEQEEDQTSASRIQNLYHAASISDDLKSQTTRQTRSIYIRGKRDQSPTARP